MLLCACLHEVKSEISLDTGSELQNPVGLRSGNRIMFNTGKYVNAGLQDWPFCDQFSKIWSYFRLVGRKIFELVFGFFARFHNRLAELFSVGRF